ncbi:hypothetical protein LCGC14_2371000, partial [marine sediment metagenome]
DHVGTGEDAIGLIFQDYQLLYKICLQLYRLS